jgi:hypothetical protein
MPQIHSGTRSDLSSSVLVECNDGIHHVTHVMSRWSIMEEKLSTRRQKFYTLQLNQANTASEEVSLGVGCKVMIVAITGQKRRPKLAQNLNCVK